MKQRSKQQAINEKCKDCIYDPLAGGTWLAQTENCPATDCPLWEFRPITTITRKKLADEKYQQMTLEERKRIDALRETARGRFKKSNLSGELP